MPLTLPTPDDRLLARRADIVMALRSIVPGEGVIAEASGRCALMNPMALPPIGSFPWWWCCPRRRSRSAGYPRILPCRRHQGGPARSRHLALRRCIAPAGWRSSRDGQVQPHPRNRFANRVAVVEPGVTNLAVTQAVEEAGFYYAPDPSSQIACTIGGNVAENSGGVHCLKYGMTTNNLLGCEMVLIDGEIIRLGGKHLDSGGYDLLGVVTGSEGLLGVITEIIVRILRRPDRGARHAPWLRLRRRCRRVRQPASSAPASFRREWR